MSWIEPLLLRIADLKQRIEYYQHCLILEPHDQHHAFMIAQYRSHIIKHLKEIAMPKDTPPRPEETPIVAFPDTTKEEAEQLIAEAIEAAKRGQQTTIILPDKSKP